MLGHSTTLAAVALLSLGATTQPAASPAPQTTLLSFDDCRINGPASICEAAGGLYSSAFAGTNYVWSFASNSSGAFFCGPTDQQSVCVDTTQAGGFRLQLDYVLQSGPKTCTYDVTVNPALSIASLAPQSVCAGEDVTFATAVLAGNGPYTYAWTVDFGSGPLPIPSATGDTLLLSAVSIADAGQYCVSVTGECGTEQACATLAVQTCGGTNDYCTLTQGAYGNGGGQWNGIGRLELLNQLLATDLVIGKPGRSFTILAGSGDCVLARLPANSGAATLPALGDAVMGAASCQTTPALPLKNGRFKNILLGQTLTLALNTRLDSNLANLGLCETMITQLLNAGPDGLRGTADDLPDAGPDGIFGTQDDVLTILIPSTVIDALANLGLPITVGGLLDLANRGLAAQATGGASLGHINDAADAINRGFDECRRLIDCQ